MNKTVLFLLILVIIYGAIGAIFYGYYRNKQNVETVPFDTQSEQTQDGVTLKTSFKGDLQITSSCGDSACFEEKFKTCKPASITASLTEDLVYYYEIIGSKDGLCQVKSKFLKNINPDWVGKEMTCTYDPAKEFNSAVQDMSNCEGPLYNLMTGQ